MKLFLVALCIFSIFCVWNEELNTPMYCSGDSVPPWDDLGEFYRESKNFDEEELVQHLREIIYFPLEYFIFEEGMIRNIPSEKFEEFVTSIYGKQFIQHFRASVQEEQRILYEVNVHFRCNPLDNKYEISIISFSRCPEKQSLINLFQDIFIPFVSSAQTKYLLNDEDFNCT